MVDNYFYPYPNILEMLMLLLSSYMMDIITA
jgi:hypothetical protein